MIHVVVIIVRPSVISSDCHPINGAYVGRLQGVSLYTPYMPQSISHGWRRYYKFRNKVAIDAAVLSTIASVGGSGAGNGT
jgi:hypothetical protein